MEALEPKHLIRIVLAGRFTVLAGDGTDITPRGGKIQGLLALLATASDLCRSRRWLEDKLWSDRGPEQASASLRQALSEIRRSMGEAAEILLSDRQTVRLREDRIEITPGTAGGEFLEGIDVRDPEFEAWLRSERHRLLALSPVAPVLLPQKTEVPQAVSPLLRRGEHRNLAVVLQKSRNVSGSLGLLEDIFVDCVALSLQEALGITVLASRPTPDLPNTVVVTVQAIPGDRDTRYLRARAVEIETERVLWSGNSAGVGTLRGPSDPDVILFANQVVEVLGDAFTLQLRGGTGLDVMVLQRLATRKLWTMDAARLAEADAMLTLADELSPCGLNLARRAQLRVFQMVERHGPDREALREEALACSRLALEREPNNSMVLALVAYTRCMLDSSPAYGAELARRSVRMNPNNPLAWDSLSHAKLYLGQVAEAHEIAIKVQRIGASAPNRFWWDMGLCLTAAVTGDQSLALKMAESSMAEAPDFRAALRHVAVLAAAAGDETKARDAIKRLSDVEQGFSIDALALDPAYPVGLVRRSGLLQSDRILGLGN